jgi:transposase
MMRGSDATSGSLFSYVDVEERIPATHPLRTIRTIVNEVLGALDTEFEALYQGTGRQSVAPERLLRASLLQAFYSVRSERQLMEQINYNLLFRWFVGLGVDDAVWDHSTFSKNRDRLLGADVAAKFLAAVRRARSSPSGLVTSAQCLSLALEQDFGSARGPVASTARLTLWVAALSGAKRRRDRAVAVLRLHLQPCS